MWEWMCRGVCSFFPLLWVGRKPLPSLYAQLAHSVYNDGTDDEEEESEADDEEEKEECRQDEETRHLFTLLITRFEIMGPITNIVENHCWPVWVWDVHESQTLVNASLLSKFWDKNIVEKKVKYLQSQPWTWKRKKKKIITTTRVKSVGARGLFSTCSLNKSICLLHFFAYSNSGKGRVGEPHSQSVGARGLSQHWTRSVHLNEHQSTLHTAHFHQQHNATQRNATQMHWVQSTRMQ